MLVFDQIRFERDGFTLTADTALAEGGRYALVGPSGSGKSTLFDILAGFAHPQRGRILWQDQEISHLPPEARPVALMFQDHNVFSHLSLAENLKLAAKSDRADMGLLEQLKIAHLADKRPTEFSGGQLARAGLARALVQDRAILALDEPSAALDAALRQDMLSLVLEFAEAYHKTLIMITHDTRDAALMPSGTMAITEGELMWERGD